MNDNGISKQIVQLTDGVLVWASFWLVALARDPFRVLIGVEPSSVSPMEDMGLVIAVAIPLVPLVLEGTGFYHQNNSLGKSLKSLITGLSASFAILLIIMIVTKALADSRFFMLGLPLILTTLIGVRSAFVHAYFRKAGRNEALKRSVQIFGSKDEAQTFLDGMSENEMLAWDIKDSMDLDDAETEELVDVLKDRSIATAVFLAGKTEFKKVSKAIELCESMGIEAMVVSDFLRTKLSIPDIEQVGGRAMITLRSTPSISYSLVAKKLLDRVGAFMLIAATSPLWLVAAIGIRLKSPQGPVFFRQQRAGMYGRPFTMWKFRTMHPDAEAQLKKVKEDVGNQMEGPVFKLDNDPRVFGFGSILRKTSIDELPQLLNVLTGEMSLVGPRPLPIYEVEEFQKSEHRRRLSVKPGITCFWQAGGRNTITSFEEWVAMDLKYIDNWSFLLDIKILLQTIPAVLFSRGAK